MQTQLSPRYQGTPEGEQAQAILRKCVHCGFCLATCPTYQLLGDELDSPRGRIYLIKQVFEGAQPTQLTQQHLDRCLTCRNCETTCPSGVDYGALIDLGRRVVEPQVERPAAQSALRWMLREGLTSQLIRPALRLGAAVRPWLPRILQDKLGAAPSPSARLAPARTHARKMLLLAGCVQPGLQANINPATARVLDAIGIQTLIAPTAGCCGAIRDHLADHDGALADMRRNIDAWLPYLDGSAGIDGVEAIVMNASGCGVTVKEYVRHLAHDPQYAEKARRISSVTRDIGEILSAEIEALRPRLRPQSTALGVHLPCTLQHGQRLPDLLEPLLRDLGFSVRSPAQEKHLCCGSAGTYSVLQPALATALRDRKLGHLGKLQCATIVSANIGCIQHLQSGTRTPVRHWIEVLEESLVKDFARPA